MELSPQTVKIYGADRLADLTGLSRRTIYRWAAEGIPGDGMIRELREAAVSKALQAAAKAKASKRARAA
jgi:hypothetical protein